MMARKYLITGDNITITEIIEVRPVSKLRKFGRSMLAPVRGPAPTVPAEVEVLFIGEGIVNNGPNSVCKLLVPPHAIDAPTPSRVYAIFSPRQPGESDTPDSFLADTSHFTNAADILSPSVDGLEFDLAVAGIPDGAVMHCQLVVEFDVPDAS